MDPAQAAELQQFEQMAQMAMGPGAVDPATRAKAGEVLAAIGQSLKHMATIQNVLDNSTDDVAIMAAASSLLRLVTDHWNSFEGASSSPSSSATAGRRPARRSAVAAPAPSSPPRTGASSLNALAAHPAPASLPALPSLALPRVVAVKQRVLTRDYLVTKLYHKGPAMQHHSLSALVQLVCRLTKFAWLDEGSPEIRAIVNHCKQFLQGTFTHCVIGLRLLSELVGEMNFKTRNRSLTQHRKVAVSFRDAALYEVFEVALTMLNSLATRALDFSTLGDATAALRIEQQLLEQALTLLERCLTFDFIGVLPDESSDDATTLQVPSSWRERIQTGSTLRLLFNLYKGCTTGKIAIFVDASAPVILPAGAGGAGGGGGGAAGGGGGFGSAASAFGAVGGLIGAGVMLAIVSWYVKWL